MDDRLILEDILKQTAAWPPLLMKTNIHSLLLPGNYWAGNWPWLSQSGIPVWGFESWRSKSGHRVSEPWPTRRVNSGTAANDQWWQCQGHQRLAAVGPAVVSSAGYSYDATLAMVPPALGCCLSARLDCLVLTLILWTTPYPSNKPFFCLSQPRLVLGAKNSDPQFVHSFTQ